MEQDRVDFWAIVLLSRPFQEEHSIITCYSDTMGMVSLFCHKGQSCKPYLEPSVKVRIEAIPKKGLWTLLECASPTYLFQLTHHDALALHQQRLKALEGICHWMLTSQFVGKASPALFHLLEKTLAFLSTAQHPFTLLDAFTLKLLVAEGKFTLKSRCSECNIQLQDIAYEEGEPYCSKHAPAMAIAFEGTEVLLLFQITHSRSLQEIDSWETTPAFDRKVYNFTHQIFSNR